MPTESRRPAGRAWPWCRAVVLREISADQRRCSSLEIFFDLGFVAVAGTLCAGLRDAVLHGSTAHGVAVFLVLFFPIFWAWTQFSLFSAGYDNDDVVQRILAGAQIVGLTLLGGTVPLAFHGNGAPFFAAFVLMRLPLVLNWWRAARHAVLDDSRGDRDYARRSCLGLVGCQLGWLALTVVPGWAGAVWWAALMVAEQTVAARAAATTSAAVFEPRHLAERVGGFGMITIGESVLAAATAMRETAHAADAGPVVATALAVLVSAFCVWWLYADGQAEPGPPSGGAPRWARAQAVCFAAVTAMGAGGEIAVVAESGDRAFDAALRAVVAGPAVVTMAALAWVALRVAGDRRRALVRALAVPVVLVAAQRTAADGPAAALCAVAVVFLVTTAVESLVVGLRLRASGPAPA